MINGPAPTPIGSESALGTALQAVATGAPNAGQAADAFAQQVQQQVQQSAQIKAAAQSGGFTVDPDTASEMIAAYNFALDEWTAGQTDIQLIIRNYPLGTSPQAKVTASWNLQAAQKLQAAYNQLGTVYQDQVDAYRSMITNYQENEANVSDAMRRAGGHA